MGVGGGQRPYIVHLQPFILYTFVEPSEGQEEQEGGLSSRVQLPRAVFPKDVPLRAFYFLIFVLRPARAEKNWALVVVVLRPAWAITQTIIQFCDLFQPEPIVKHQTRIFVVVKLGLKTHFKFECSRGSWKKPSRGNK